ncbi:zonular occludens toxin [Vibrio sp. ZSDZ65]|uniref:Zonular occludens toxin n=1 Tax=Vibrio qingdaonensis TaxID=2829491 RepID=A0A9X3HW68_9VIBR|nr:zonular occludens toxin domain-containing protein [Vibrio qingdaonensis]MCW8345979.1 zonular occludens toxin [Vibrio qingdaonensis]
MAIIIRHGSNGSYKTATAVWYDLLPALRSGRIVVTNIQGIATVNEIESRLGERFPPSAQIIKVYSLTEKGRNMWQNFYNWMPMGAFILIDEMQNIFNKTVGFDMAKNQFQGIDPFLDHLPAWYPDFYRRNLESYRPNEDDIDTDDLGETLLDDNGLIRLPPTFEESMSRHRHFNWDITFVTPEIKNIPMDVRGCAELAIHHKSKDSVFFTKRKPRLYEHDPKSTSVKPAKDDYTTTQKVPIAVHLLYKSTVTGKTTKSGAASNPFLSIKIIGILLITIASFIGLGVSVYDILTRGDNDSVSTEQTTQALPDTTDTTQTTTQVNASPRSQANEPDSIPNDTHQPVHSDIDNAPNDKPRFNHGDIESPANVWPYPVQHLYVSSVVVRVDAPNVYTTVLFKQVYPDGTEGYVNDALLEQIGYTFDVLDYCLVNITYQSHTKLVACDSRPTQHNIETAQAEPTPEPQPNQLDEAQSLLPISTI